MTHKKKWIGVLLVLCLIGALVAGCGSSSSSSSSSESTTSEPTEEAEGQTASSEEGESEEAGAAETERTIGVFTFSPTNEYWNILKTGAEEEASRNNVNLLVQASTNDSDVGGGIAKVENLLTQGAEAIVISPLAEAFQPVLERAANEGIPVICVNNCVEGWDGATTEIETDNLKAGEIAGEYISSLMKGGGTVGTIECGVAYKSCVDRQKGAEATVASNVEVAGPLEAGCELATAVKAAQNLLTSNPELKGMYAGCGQDALGAVHVLEGEGHSDIPVVGVDGVKEEMQSIREGKENATVAQFPMKMGELGVEQALKALNGEKVEKHIDSGEELVTKENVDQFEKENFPA